MKEMENVVAVTNMEEYMKAFNNCFKAINKDAEKNDKGVLVKQMISLFKSICMNQSYLETMLELPFEIARRANKNRSLQMTTALDSLSKQTFFKWTTAMEKSEFIKTTLMEDINLEEFFEVIKLLLQQTHIIAQIRESKTNVPLPLVDKFIFTTSEFSNIYISLQKDMKQMTDLEANPQYQRELEQMKNFYYFEQTSNLIDELGRFTRKLCEYQQKIVMYHVFVRNFSSFRKEIQELCYTNFGLIVDLKPPV